MAGTEAAGFPQACPQCSGTLETGVLLAPRGIYWGKKVRWSILAAEPIVSMLSSLKMPNVRASRCQSCKLVFFGYAWADPSATAH